MEKIEIKNTKYQTVFDCILQHRTDLNYNLLKTTLRKKDIRVNNKRITENMFINTGDNVTLFIKEKEPIKIDIVYKDDNIVVANKPQGMEVTKKDKTFVNSDCLEDCVTGYLACHRIDMNTGGLVIMAKNKQLFDKMSECIKEHKVDKHYQAVVCGNVKQKDNLVDYLEKCDDIVKVYKTQAKNSKIAKTNYKLLKSNNGLYLLDIEIFTGRTHQIRAQLASHGIFILGDEKYGNKDANKTYHTKRQQLFAYKLTFHDMPHPFEYLNGKTVSTKPKFTVEL